jgi:hypothetical protein
MQSKEFKLIQKIRNQIQTFQKTDEQTTLILKINSYEIENHNLNETITEKLSRFINRLLKKIKVSVIDFDIDNQRCLCEWFFRYELRFYLDLYFKIIETDFEIISIIYYNENENEDVSENETVSEDNECEAITSCIRDYWDYSDAYSNDENESDFEY